MMEREVVADHYELVRRAKPLLEAVQCFRGLRAKARHVLFSKHTSQKPLLDQLQRFSHNADKQPHEDLVLRSRYLFLYRVFRPLIRGDDNQLPKRIDLVRRIPKSKNKLRSGAVSFCNCSFGSAIRVIFSVESRSPRAAFERCLISRSSVTIFPSASSTTHA